MVLAAIASSLTGDADTAAAWVGKASEHLMDDPASGSNILERVGTALLAIDRPELAIELFDEAMECAMMAKDDDRYETLSTCMVQAEMALDDSERENIPVYVVSWTGSRQRSGCSVDLGGDTGFVALEILVEHRGQFVGGGVVSLPVGPGGLGVEAPQREPRGKGWNFKTKAPR